MPLLPSSVARRNATLACGLALALWTWRGGSAFLVAVVVSATLLVLAWVAPAAFAVVQRGLEWLMHRLLTGLTWALLALVYFGVLFPLRCLRAAGGRDPLDRRWRPEAATYLRPVATATLRRFERQF